MSRAMAIGAGTKGSGRSGTNASGMLTLPVNLATQSSIALSLAERPVQLTGAVGAGGGVGDAKGDDVGEVGGGGPHVMVLHERP